MKRLLDIFKAKKRPEPMAEPYISSLRYRGIPIEITFHVEESKAHLSADYDVLRQEGIDKIIRKSFIPWFKGEQFQDRDDDRVFDGLKVYAIDYTYSKVAAPYSPTGEDGFFGQFEFDFESGNAYTSDMLESTAMQVYVYENKIASVRGYEI